RRRIDHALCGPPFAASGAAIAERGCRDAPAIVRARAGIVCGGQGLFIAAGVGPRRGTGRGESVCGEEGAAQRGGGAAREERLVQVGPSVSGGDRRYNLGAQAGLRFVALFAGGLGAFSKLGGYGRVGS